MICTRSVCPVCSPSPSCLVKWNWVELSVCVEVISSEMPMRQTQYQNSRQIHNSYCDFSVFWVFFFFEISFSRLFHCLAMFFWIFFYFFVLLHFVSNLRTFVRISSQLSQILSSHRFGRQSPFTSFSCEFCVCEFIVSHLSHGIFLFRKKSGPGNQLPATRPKKLYSNFPRSRSISISLELAPVGLNLIHIYSNFLLFFFWRRLQIKSNHDQLKHNKWDENKKKLHKYRFCC